MTKHKLVLEIEYECEDGWPAANKVAMKIGRDVLDRFSEVIEVDGHVDPEITEGRVSVEARL